MSKVTFKRVSMKNFMSYGNVPTVVELDSGTTFGIIGDNRDIGSEGSSKNGCGKSASYAAIIYAAFGKSIDKLKADDFINLTNSNKMVVDLEFSKSGVDYRISRGRKPNYLTFHVTIEGETTELTMDSMANTDREIEKVLGMTYDIFMSTVFLSPHREAFYEMGGPAQRNIIEQMLSLDVLTERAEALKIIRGDLAVDIKVKGREIELHDEQAQQWKTRKERLQAAVDSWSRDKEQKLENWEAELQTKLDVPVKEITGLLKEVDHHEKKLTDVTNDVRLVRSEFNSKVNHKTQVSTLVSDISKLKNGKMIAEEDRKVGLADIQSALDEVGDVSDFDRYIGKHSEWKRTQERLKATVRDIREADAQIERGEEDLIRFSKEIDAIRDGLCPTCGAHYEDDVKLRKIEKSLERTQKLIADAKAEKEKAEESRLELESSIEGIEDIVKTLSDEDIGELKSALSEVTALESRRAALLSQPMRDYDEEIKTLKDRLETLEEPASDEEIEETKTTLQELTVLQEEIEERLNEVKRDLRKYKITTLGELHEVKSAITTLENRISELKHTQNPHEKELNLHVGEEPVVSEALEKELKVLEDQVTHTNYLIKLLTDSKSFIRRGILDRYIPFLNQKINGYLQTIGLPHVVEVSTDLNVDLHYMGKCVSYYNLSRGERLRLNIATTLAFRDLMLMIGKSTNLLLIDEVLDSGLDECGIISTASLLKGSADDVFIITHRSELMDTLEKRLTVIKENGFARIEVS